MEFKKHLRNILNKNSWDKKTSKQETNIGMVCWKDAQQTIQAERVEKNAMSHFKTRTTSSVQQHICARILRRKKSL